MCVASWWRYFTVHAGCWHNITNRNTTSDNATQPAAAVITLLLLLPWQHINNSPSPLLLLQWLQLWYRSTKHKSPSRYHQTCSVAVFLLRQTWSHCCCRSSICSCVAACCHWSRNLLEPCWRWHHLIICSEFFSIISLWENLSRPHFLAWFIMRLAALLLMLIW